MWHQCFWLVLCRWDVHLLTGDSHNRTGVSEMNLQPPAMQSLPQKAELRWELENANAWILRHWSLHMDMYLHVKMFSLTQDWDALCSDTKWQGQVFWQNFTFLCAVLGQHAQDLSVCHFVHRRRHRGAELVPMLLLLAFLWVVFRIRTGDECCKAAVHSVFSSS